MKQRLGVVGAGIVGLALARELLARRPDATVVVLEKEGRIGLHQTSHNSGVIHAGIQYRPGSLKARLCTRGALQLKDYCSEHNITYRECGKLIVALDGEEATTLRTIYDRGIANGVADLKLVDRTEMKSIEPHVEGILGVYSPRTAVVDYEKIARAFARDIEHAGGTIRCGFQVDGLTHIGGEIEVRCGTETIRFDRVILCAGLQADRLARQAGDSDDPRIIPFRGEYFHLPANRRHLVRGLIYPVPDPSTPFLGIHLSRHVDDRVSLGPNAVLALARQGYRRRDIVVRDCQEIMVWPGFRKMARSYWRSGLSEMMGSASKHVYLRRAQRYVPELRLSDLGEPSAGVRAQAVDREGRLIDDFAVRKLGSITAVRNAPSPGATSCLAIASHLCDYFLDDVVPRQGPSTP